MDLVPPASEFGDDVFGKKLGVASGNVGVQILGA